MKPIALLAGITREHGLEGFTMKGRSINQNDFSEFMHDLR
jgi:hypothetical protein